MSLGSGYRSRGYGVNELRTKHMNDAYLSAVRLEACQAKDAYSISG